MSKYYPKGIPKSSVRPVVLRTSIVLFAEHTSGGPPVSPHSKQQCTSARPSVRSPPEDQCLASIFLKVQRVF
jgi:hypothetical protein